MASCLRMGLCVRLAFSMLWFELVSFEFCLISTFTSFMHAATVSMTSYLYQYCCVWWYYVPGVIHLLQLSQLFFCRDLSICQWREGLDKDIKFRTESSKGAHSLRTIQLWLSVLTTIYYNNKLLWGGFYDSLA